jgi:hypothetical protein
MSTKKDRNDIEIDEIKLFLKMQRSRGGRPIDAYNVSSLKLAKGFDEILTFDLSSDSKALYYQLSVTRIATMLECFYRDSLDAIFRLCKPTAYISSIDKIVNSKYSVSEIITFEINGIHLLESISQGLSFQGIPQIFSVYDNFFPGGFRKELLSNEYRAIPDGKSIDDQFEESDIIKITENDFKYLQSMYQDRHNFIHNPGGNLECVPDNFWHYLNAAWRLTFCSEKSLVKYMNGHIKDSVVIKK